MSDLTRREFEIIGGLGLLGLLAPKWAEASVNREVDAPGGREILSLATRWYPAHGRLTWVEKRHQGSCRRPGEPRVVRAELDRATVLQVRLTEAGYSLTATSPAGRIIVAGAAEGVERVTAHRDRKGGVGPPRRVKAPLGFDTVVQSQNGVWRTCSADLAQRHVSPVWIPSARIPAIYDQFVWLVLRDIGHRR